MSYQAKDKSGVKKDNTYRICAELEAVKKNYDTNIVIVEGLNFRQRDVIRTIEFYSNSKYLGGQKDEQERDKPFYNILNGMCDVENAAKDIDTKDISATSDDGNHYTESFLLSKDIYEWMKEVNFAKILNDIRDMHTRYGSVLVKKVMKADEDDPNGNRQLTLELPEWKNTITDQLDVERGAIVEIHYMNPMELMAMSEWNRDKIVALVKKMAKSGAAKRVPVYEVRGEFPESCYNEIAGLPIRPRDEYNYTYQLHYLAADPKSQGDPITTEAAVFSQKLTPLYCENNTERVYKYLARKKKAGRDFGVGVMEEGDESQVWTNDAVLKQHRAMEYTTKVVAQTASKRLKGRNVMSEVDDGTILEHEDNKPITALQLLPSGGLTQYAGLIEQWYAQLERATSAFAMQRGEVTTKNFRLQSLALQQSQSVFNDLQEEMGIFITDLFKDWIMPYLAAQLNTEHILAHEFSMEELREIDKNFSTSHANEMAKKLILSGHIVTPEDYQAFQDTAKEVIGQTKSQRFLKVPKDFYKNAALKITVNVTGEQKNKAIALESLTNILTIYAKNPQIAQDPVLMQIFMKIVEMSGAGISPVSLVAAIHEQARQQKEAQLKAAAMGTAMPGVGGAPAQDPNAPAGPAVPVAGPMDGTGPIPAPKDLSLTAGGGRAK